MSSERVPKYRYAKSCGARIARMRIDKGWSQRELARRAQFSYQQISKVELGDINTPIETLARLAAVLEVRLQAIVEDDPEHLSAVGVGISTKVTTGLALLDMALPMIADAAKAIRLAAQKGTRTDYTDIFRTGSVLQRFLPRISAPQRVFELAASPL
jgi:transcriptional regulator with XRE-family HTH domain